MTHASVVFDFDGTVALGQGPLDAYADCVGELAGAQVAADCRAAVRLFATGTSDHPDGYAAVRAAALRHGVDDDVLSAAYLRSREMLATEAAPIHAPAGLDTFLRMLSHHATCVIATNAPAIGLARALESLGIADVVDEVHAGVGKPAGLTAIIARHLATGPTLAVGDIWENDLAPAQALGAATAFVGIGRIAGQPTLRGTTLAALYDDILDWAQSASPRRREPSRDVHDLNAPRFAPSAVRPPTER
jgi:phosphoglycolate phosphatase-like HAD superfamily hydrolase